MVKYVIGESFGNFHLICDLGGATDLKGELGIRQPFRRSISRTARKLFEMGSRQKRKR
jgi:hypothetical protein